MTVGPGGGTAGAPRMAGLAAESCAGGPHAPAGPHTAGRGTGSAQAHALPGSGCGGAAAQHASQHAARQACCGDGHPGPRLCSQAHGPAGAERDSAERAARGSGGARGGGDTAAGGGGSGGVSAPGGGDGNGLVWPREWPPWLWGASEEERRAACGSAGGAASSTTTSGTAVDAAAGAALPRLACPQCERYVLCERLWWRWWLLGVPQPGVAVPSHPLPSTDNVPRTQWAVRSRPSALP